MIFLEEVGFEPGSAKNVNDKNYKAVTLSITPQLLLLTGLLVYGKVDCDIKHQFTLD